MKNIRCAAQGVGIGISFLIGASLLVGCGESRPNESLLTIDSAEMQSALAEIETEKHPPDPATASTKNTPKQQAAPAERPPAIFASEKSRSVDESFQLAAASAKPNLASTNVAKIPATATDSIPNGIESVKLIGSDPAKFLPTEPREVKLLVPDNSFQKVEPDGALRVSYDDVDLLKILNMDPVSLDAPELMPKWLKDLDGKRIRLRGFMYPPYSQTDIPAFVLARDNEICCFGRNPKPYDVIQIVMRKGETTNYIQNRPFDVVGTFHIEMLTYDDKKVDGLYLIDDAIVIDR